MRRLLCASVMVALAASSACRRSRSSPEEQVRQAIERVVEAVRDKNLKPVAAAVSAQYADRDGNDKNAVVSLVRVQFVVRPSLYVVAKATSMEVTAPTEVESVVFAVMAAVPAGPPPDLRELARQTSADIYRFVLRWESEDGVWRVRHATWSPATIADLL